MTFLTYECRNCGAGIDVQPDNLLTVCRYCGDLYPARDIGDVPVHIVPSRTQEEVVNALHQRMAADRDMKGVQYSVQSVEGVYVPLYVNYVAVQGGWQGYVLESHNNKTVKVPKQGHIDHRGDFPVLARKHAHEFGLAQIGPVVCRCQPVPFRAADWRNSGLPVLAVDVDEAEVDAMVADDLLDMLGQQIRDYHKLDGITWFEATPQVASRFILLFPLWTAIYLYQGGSYRVALEGSGPSVLVAMEPVFRRQRLKRFIAALSATAAAGLIWYFGWWLLFVGDSDDAGKAFLFVIALIIGAMATAWHMAGKMLASVNVEGIDEEGVKAGFLRKHPQLAKVFPWLRHLK
ncbi:MAG: hypothetical protein JRI23_04475 [Deltaproteobacteria bacterium]|jgi:hypothetical protein|nr:hypothetical protein [Deltaproteobacteria bacterium]MBW2530799.1 hypothetical protein [Deltaproteobacteria bacterium]